MSPLLDPQYMQLTQMPMQTDLEAAEMGLDGVYEQLVSVGMEPLLATPYALLHIITARRLDRLGLLKGASSVPAVAGSSGLPECGQCCSRDHISRPVCLCPLF